MLTFAMVHLRYISFWATHTINDFFVTSSIGLIINISYAKFNDAILLRPKISLHRRMTRHNMTHIVHVHDHCLLFWCYRCVQKSLLIIDSSCCCILLLLRKDSTEINWWIITVFWCSACDFPNLQIMIIKCASTVFMNFKIVLITQSI